jgi:hypothetical protein
LPLEDADVSHSEPVKTVLKIQRPISKSDSELKSLCEIQRLFGSTSGRDDVMPVMMVDRGAVIFELDVAFAMMIHLPIGLDAVFSDCHELDNVRHILLNLASLFFVLLRGSFLPRFGCHLGISIATNRKYQWGGGGGLYSS